VTSLNVGFWQTSRGNVDSALSEYGYMHKSFASSRDVMWRQLTS